MPHYKRSPASKAFDALVYAFMILSVAIIVLPFMNIVSKAFSQSWAVTSGSVGLFPVGFQLKTMAFVLATPQFARSMGITILVSAFGTALALFMTVLAAYPLSKKELPGIKAAIMLYVFTMLFSGGLIPTYLLVKDLGLMNKLGSLVFPGLIDVFNLLVVKSYFEGLPPSIEESARIDGAHNLTVLFKIILPVSGPILATIGLFYAVGFWNDYFNPMLYISTPSLRPLQLYLQDIIVKLGSASASYNLDVGSDLAPEGIRAAMVVASTIPILCVYPFLQKYFTQGVLVGSVKG
jgi:putative aldouronate transport system permease protein